MSAAEAAVAQKPTKKSVELTLARGGTELHIYCCSNSHAHVDICTVPRGKAKRERLVFTIASFGPGQPEIYRQQFMLCRKFEHYSSLSGHLSLWLGSTAFDLSTEEALRVEETFAPHGLTVERKESAS